MPAGKQNDLREKMNNLAAMPEGVHFDPAATWQQLEARLQRRSSRRPLYWYWAAAVFLLLITGILLMRNQESPAAIEPVTVQAKGKEEPPEQDPGIGKPVARVEVSQPQKKTQQKILVNKALSTSKDSSPTIYQQSIPFQQTVLITPLLDSSAVAKDKPAKRKFKVAHINELSPPEPLNVLPSKNNTAVKRPPFSTMSEVPFPDEDRMIPRKKRTGLFLTSSSQ